MLPRVREAKHNRLLNGFQLFLRLRSRIMVRSWGSERKGEEGKVVLPELERKAQCNGLIASVLGWEGVLHIFALF